MTARPLVLLGLLATGLLQPAAVSAQDTLAFPPAHVGDQALYSTGRIEPTVGMEWLGVEPAQDRWGRAWAAHVLRSVMPAYEVHPEGDPGGLAEVRSAFAGEGESPLWRAFQLPGDGRLTLPDAGGRPSLGEGGAPGDVTRTMFSPPPMFRECLPYHGLQATRLDLSAASEVTLGRLCPGLGGAEGRLRPEVSASIFAGRASLQFLYRVGPEKGSLADVGLPAGATLRIVASSGLPFLARAVATDAQGHGLWSFRLHGFEEGEGPPIPPGGRTWPQARSPATLSGSRGPLGDSGPADGGTGLRYRLDEAVGHVLRDPTLVSFHRWRESHPGAFLARAELESVSSPGGVAQQRWQLVFGEPSNGSGSEAYSVSTQRFSVTDATLLGREPLDTPVGFDGGPVLVEAAFVRPAGEALTVSAALAWSEERLPGMLRGGELAGLRYEAGGPGRSPRMGVATSPPTGAGATEAEMVLDLLSGASLELNVAHENSPFGGLDILPAALVEPSDVSGVALPAIGRLWVITAVGFTLLALLAALLAYAGYLTAGFSRLRQSDLLDNPARRRVYDLVRARPGIHFKGVMAGTGLGSGTTMYHLRVLERGGFVAAVPLPGFRRYYLTGSVPHDALRGQAELASGSARAVYEAVRNHPGISLSNVAKQVRVTPPAAHRTVERLRAAGLVEKTAHGREVRLTAREAQGRN